MLNFEKVEYLSSSALNILIALDNAIRKKSGQLRLSGLDKELRKVFTLMKLNKVMVLCDSVDEAVEIANGTAYALTGGFYSRSPGNIARVRREFRVGNLYVNRKITGALVDRQPFGGFKLSGIGSKAGGPDYLLQFLLPRVITENTMRSFAHGAAASPQPASS